MLLYHCVMLYHEYYIATRVAGLKFSLYFVTFAFAMLGYCRLLICAV